MLFRQNSPPIGKPAPYEPPDRISSWEEFEQLHAPEYARMAFYWTRWQKSHKPKRVGHEELHPDNAKLMYAVNMQSRMDFVRIAHRHISEFFERRGDTHGHWITIAPGQFTMSMDEAADFDVRRLHHWVYQALRGMHYIGMVEPGYYEIRVSPIEVVHFVSWHVHLLACINPDASAILSRAESNCGPTLGGPPVHCEDYKRNTLLKRVYYMMKTPWKRMRKRRRPLMLTSPTTGEVRELHFRKDPLRSNQISKLYDVMGRRVLDKMLFGGGDGVAVARAIRDEALAPLPKWLRKGDPRPR